MVIHRYIESLILQSVPEKPLVQDKLHPHNRTGRDASLRTCLHKKYMWIFEHNFVACKAKIRRRAVARQVFFTQDAAKFAEKTRGYACEDRF